MLLAEMGEISKALILQGTPQENVARIKAFQEQGRPSVHVNGKRVFYANKEQRAKALLRMQKKRNPEAYQQSLKNFGWSDEDVHKADKDWKNISQRQTEITRSNKAKRTAEATAGAGALGLAGTLAIANKRKDIRQAVRHTGDRSVRELQIGIKPEWSNNTFFDKPRPKPFGIRTPVSLTNIGGQTFLGSGPKEFQAVSRRFVGRASLPYAAALGGSAALVGGGLLGSGLARARRRHNEQKIAEMRRSRFKRTGRKYGAA